MNTPPPGWQRVSVDEYAPAGRPKQGSIWYRGPGGAATSPALTEEAAIDAAWACQAHLDRLLALVQQRRAA